MSSSLPHHQAETVSITSLILNSVNAQSLLQSIHSPTIKWTPSLVNSIIKRLWNHGPKALEFFRILTLHPSYRHHSSSFDYAIDISARLRDFHFAWKLVSCMRSLHIGPSPRTFAIIAERYATAGKPHRAFKVFLAMNEYGCNQDLTCFNAILYVLCKSGHAEMASNLFKILGSRFKADSITYNVLANGWCLIKQMPKALDVLKKMVESGLRPTMATYNTVLRGYFRTGQIDEAWLFFLEMKKRKCEVDVVTYTTLIHGFGAVGEIQRARNIFDQMMKKRVVPSVATYNALIQILCKKKNVLNAILVFDDMVNRGYLPNMTTYNLVVGGLCYAGEMEKAMEFFGRMKSDGCEPNVQTYNLVIRYSCHAGMMEKGVDLFRKMNNEGCLPNLDTYNILISAMFVRKKSDDVLLAGKLLVEMIDRGFLPRKFVFNRVLNGLLLTGNHAFAKNIVRYQSRSGRIPIRLKI